ncbi:MAG: RNA polymerase sigma factor [Kiritimatiellaeota bacterium]|nr:RNA polymerase sigma factor [Kiritimatiellota bacterium]
MNSDGAADSDQAIIERVRRGDINAFADLLTRYRAWVFAIVLKHVPPNRADEMAHDIFVEAYKALPTYRGTAEFRHWLAGIAVRQCFTFWRRVSRQPVCCVLNDLSDETQTWLDRSSRTESQEIFDRQTSRQAARELLAYALERLSAEDRTLVTLLHMEERPVREVAQLMAWSPINVKVRAYRARQRMRRIIGQLLKHEEEPRRETQ